MSFRQKNNPFKSSRSSLNMSSAFKAEDDKLIPEEYEKLVPPEESIVGQANPNDPYYDKRNKGEMNYGFDEEGEALPDAHVGASYDIEGNMSPQDSLAFAAAKMEGMFIDNENPTNEDGSLNYVKEGMAPQKDYIENTLFADVGYDGDSKGDPWSAAAVSNLAKAFDPEFKGSAQHAQYINRAFQGEGNYFPTKLNKRNRKDLQIGDILFKGRSDGPETYKDFKNAAKDGWNDMPNSAGYKSHSDIIIDSYEKGGVMYYTVQGGNVGDTVKVKDYTAQQLADYYAGRLTQ